MSLENIAVISFGFFEEEVLKSIGKAIAREYDFRATSEEGHLDLSEYYDPTRRQYDANRILKAVDEKYGRDTFKTFGLFSVDLFIPILTYIYGQAYLNGRTGIASIYRLSNERYGMSSDDELMMERLEKVVVHELGHTFGLVHCLNPVCVMRPSTYVEDIDQKGKTLCLKCRTELGLF